MSNASTIKMRLAYYQIDEATSSLLRENKDFVMLELPGVLDEFYENVGGFPETATFFNAST